MFLNGFIFSEENNIRHIKSAYQIRSYDCIKIAILFYLNVSILLCSWSDKTALSPKKILNVDLSWLKCTEFFHGFQKIRTCFKF